MAVRADGTVVKWGQIAFSDEPDVPGDATNMAAWGLGPGAQHALGLRQDGSVLEWGTTNHQLQEIPADLGSIVSVAAGAYHSLALRADGTVVSWGQEPAMEMPEIVPSWATNVVSIAAGWYHNLALRADGTVVAWGRDYSPGYGQTNVPASATNILAVACGGLHSLALKRDGTLLSFGYLNQASVPAWATNLVGIAGTSHGSLALIGDGEPRMAGALIDRWVWPGSNAYFYAEAVGAWPLGYQWRKNGSDMPGATNAWLVVRNADAAAAGTYSVVVSNSQGNISSRGARLDIGPRFRFLPGSSAAGSGQFWFRGTGDRGYVWCVDGSTNLSQWVELATLTNLNGTVTFTNQAANGGQAYYRLRLAQ